MAGTDALKALDEEYAKHGQIQIVDADHAVENSSTYISLPGRMTNRQLAHES